MVRVVTRAVQRAGQHIRWNRGLKRTRRTGVTDVNETSCVVVTVFWNLAVFILHLEPVVRLSVILAFEFLSTSQRVHLYPCICVRLHRFGLGGCKTVWNMHVCLGKYGRKHYNHSYSAFDSEGLDIDTHC